MGSRILFSAAFGGVAPTLLKAAIASQNSGFRLSLIFSDPRFALDVVGGFFIGAVIMGALGAGVAYAFQERDMRKAFFVGLGVPSLLTVGAVTASQPSPVGIQLESSMWHRFQFMGVLHATQRPSPQPSTILFKFPNDMKVTELLAIFEVENGKDVARTFKVGEELQVPPGARNVQLDSAVYFSPEITLPGNAPAQTVIELQPEDNGWFGFWSALGVHSRPIRLKQVQRPRSGPSSRP
jgi:hypothetical protein